MTERKGFDVENLGDELIDRVEPAKEFIQKNSRSLLYVIAGIVLLAGGLYGWTYLKGKKNEEAKNDIWKLQFYFEKDSFNLVLNGRPDSDPMKAIKSAQDIIDEYKGTEQASLAHYYAGVACLKTGKYDEAIDHFKNYSGSDDIVGAMAIGLTGDAMVEKGPDNYKDAVSYYEKAAAHHSNQYTTPMYLKKAGMVYEELKEFKKAQNCYELIKKDYPKSNEAREIDKYLERAKALAVQG
jgi:tetratricopeptide (TPR) repeat protein